MIKILGNDPKLLKQTTCSNCASILQYAPCDVVKLGGTDERMGFKCPQCGTTIRTNP